MPPSQVLDFIDLMGVAPQAGFEPATLRFLESVMQVVGLAGSSCGSSDENLLFPGVRQSIVQRLFSAALDGKHQTDKRPNARSRMFNLRAITIITAINS